MFGDSLSEASEDTVALLSESDLEPNIAGTKTLVQALDEHMDREIATRFSGGPVPGGDVAFRVQKGMAELFAGYQREIPPGAPVWKSVLSTGLSVVAFRFRSRHIDFPVFGFENPAVPDGGAAFYLPESGTLRDSSTLTDLVGRYHRVYCVDYMTLGELRSDAFMRHTMARHFMFNSPSLPRLIVDDLRSYLGTLEGPVDVHGNGWASSFFAASLKYLEPGRVRG